MQVRILGPLEVRADGGVVPIHGAKRRALLAVLGLHANQPVSVERLALALWGEEAPVGAVKAVQVHVSRLRKALGDPEALETIAAGYRLVLGPGELDLESFEDKLAAGREALAAGEPERAGELLRGALGLWRGPPLEEFGWAPFAAVEMRRLEELRLSAVEVRVGAELAAGRHAEAVPELQRLAAEHPLRERLHAQLMLALYRSGRQAEALEAYQRVRNGLVDQLGIEPGPELHEMQRAVLMHDSLPATTLAATPAPVLRRSALPVHPNSTIGREREVWAIGERLRTGATRMHTLTGPGGVGKTRLAVEVAKAIEDAFADGVHFVSLASVPDAREVAAAIVNGLGIIGLRGETAEQSVERFLSAKHVLLVVDNCEHLPAAAPFIAGLSVACPGVTVLATSRAPLAVSSEQRWRVAPLAVPDRGASVDAERLAGVASVTLFCERARAEDPDFELDTRNARAVVEICRRLDGLPLAIELAAARCGLLSTAEIAERLAEMLGTLGAGPSDAPARQRTLRATIDWSHDLLSDAAQACFARFAVFAGGATVDAAEVVTGCDLDTLEQLVAHNLLARRPGRDLPARLEMLETVRVYAAERFEQTADADAVRHRRHAYFLALARRHCSPQALWSTRGEQHLAALDAEIDNLHAALAWAVDRMNTKPALELSVALGWYWVMRYRYEDAVRWIDAILALPGADAHPAARVQLLRVKAEALWALGRGNEQAAILADAEHIARALGDPVSLTQVLGARAGHLGHSDAEGQTRAVIDEALAVAAASGDEWEMAHVAAIMVMTASSRDELRDHVEHATRLLRRAGNTYTLALMLTDAAYDALLLGGDDDALHYVTRALPLARELNRSFVWLGLQARLGLAALFNHDLSTATAAFREELLLCREQAVLPLAYDGLAGMAALAALRGESRSSARLAGAASAHRYDHAQNAIDTRLDAEFYATSRHSLGPAAWDSASLEGSRLSLDEAIKRALTS